MKEKIYFFDKKHYRGKLDKYKILVKMNLT